MSESSRKNNGVPTRIKARWLSWILLLLFLVAAGFAWDFLVQKNFDAVVPERLYRSGQPSERQLEDWIREYGLKGILTLRHGLPPYEKELADRYGVNLYQRTFSAKTGLTDQQWEDIHRILTDEANLPLLIHCHSGVDRTGLVTALYRIDEQGWPLDKALREMYLHYHLPFQYPALRLYLQERYKQEPVGEVPAFP